MGHVGEAVFGTRLGGPALDLRSFDFDSTAAVATDKMVVVVLAGAAAVTDFAVVAPQDVELTSFGEGPNLVVDGGEGDVLALGLQFAVQLLGGSEPVGGFQDGGQGPLLPR